MSFDIRVDENTNLVTVIYNADTSYEDRVNVLNELVNILQKKLKLNILIDARNAKENMTYHEQVKYGVLIANNKQYFSENKTAVLTVKNKNPHPIILTKTYLEGLDNIREFYFKNEALEWMELEH